MNLNEGGQRKASAAKAGLRASYEKDSETQALPSTKERLLSGLLDLCGLEAFAIDRAGRIVHASAALRSGGLKPNATLWDLFPESVASARYSAADEIFQACAPGIIEIEAALGPAKVFFEDSISPLDGANGLPELALFISRDLGGRLRQDGLSAQSPLSSRTPNLTVLSCGWLERPEAALRGDGRASLRDYAKELRERETERDAIGNGLDGVLVEHLDRSLQLLWGNREICKISGLPLEQLKGKPCFEAVRGAAEPCEGCTAAKAIQTSSPQEGEINSPDGRSFKSKSLPLRDEKGEVRGVMHLAMDITEWRDLDERMRQARAKAEELARAKSDFLACISHEIRTPLNAIVGMAELLKDSAPKGDVEIAECCSEIEKASDMLLTIINDILDYSLLEAGSVKVFNQSFDLREEINSVAGLMARKAAQKGLEFKLEISEALPWSVCGDPRHLRRILVNLMGNAVKFTEAGSVSVRALNAGRRDGGHTVKIEIEDTGVGVAEDSLERIFEPFTQEDSTSSRIYSGTGLGLAIVRKLLGVIGGSIEVRSRKGAGSLFSVSLPLKDPSSAPPSASEAGACQAQSAGAFQGVRALLLDASPSAALMKRILETLGVEPHLETPGEAVFRKLSEGAYDIVFFDSVAAGELGLHSFAELLRGKGGAKTPPLVALAASASGRGADSRERELCQKAGIAALLSKPPRRSQIAYALRSHCSARAKG